MRRQAKVTEEWTQDEIARIQQILNFLRTRGKQKSEQFTQCSTYLQQLLSVQSNFQQIRINSIAIHHYQLHGCNWITDRIGALQMLVLFIKDALQVIKTGDRLLPLTMNPIYRKLYNMDTLLRQSQSLMKVSNQQLLCIPEHYSFACLTWIEEMKKKKIQIYQETYNHSRKYFEKWIGTWKACPFTEQIPNELHLKKSFGVKFALHSAIIQQEQLEHENAFVKFFEQGSQQFLKNVMQRMPFPSQTMIDRFLTCISSLEIFKAELIAITNFLFAKSYPMDQSDFKRDFVNMENFLETQIFKKSLALTAFAREMSAAPFGMPLQEHYNLQNYGYMQLFPHFDCDDFEKPEFMDALLSLLPTNYHLSHKMLIHSHQQLATVVKKYGYKKTLSNDERKFHFSTIVDLLPEHIETKLPYPRRMIKCARMFYGYIDFAHSI